MRVSPIAQLILIHGSKKCKDPEYVHGWSKAILKFPLQEQRLVQAVVMNPASETRLQSHLQLVGLKIKVATDGSMESDSRCSFAWTLHTQSSRNSIPTQTAACAGPVDGD